MDDGEVIRFRLEAGFFDLVRIEDPQSMVGSEIPVSYGDERLTGVITAVSSGDDGTEVTMRVRARPGEDGLPAFLAF